MKLEIPFLVIYKLNTIGAPQYEVILTNFVHVPKGKNINKYIIPWEKQILNRRRAGPGLKAIKQRVKKEDFTCYIGFQIKPHLDKYITYYPRILERDHKIKWLGTKFEYHAILVYPDVPKKYKKMIENILNNKNPLTNLEKKWNQ